MLAPELSTAPPGPGPLSDPHSSVRRRRLRNTLANIPSLLRERSLSVLRGTHANDAIAIVETTSDLVEGITSMRSSGERLVVIATPVTYAALLEENIEPDYVVATAVDDVHDSWADASGAPRTRLIAEAGAAPALFRAFSGRSHTFSTAAGQPWPWLRRMGLERTRLPARASVIGTAAEIAEYLGASRIRRIGASDAVIVNKRTSHGQRQSHVCARDAVEPRVHNADAHLLRVLRELDLDVSVPPAPVISVVTPFSTIPMEERVELTATLVDHGETDLARWSDSRNLDPQWSGRSWHAARLITPGSHVLDVGAGAQALKQFLTSDCRYTPSDVVARTPDTRVADLNRGEFPHGCYDVVTALGVLEYVNDLSGMLAAMRQAAPTAVVSYAASVGGTPADRLKHGWVNALTLHDIVRLATASGWMIAGAQSLNSTAVFEQWLFALRAAKDAAC